MAKLLHGVSGTDLRDPHTAPPAACGRLTLPAVRLCSPTRSYFLTGRKAP